MSNISESVTPEIKNLNSENLNSITVLHQPSSIHLIPAGTELIDSSLGIGIRKILKSQNSTLYTISQKLGQTNRFLGGVLDSGAQRGATGRKSEILKHTGTSLLMQPAVGLQSQSGSN